MPEARYFAAFFDREWHYFAAENEECVRKFYGNLYETDGIGMPSSIREAFLDEVRRTSMFSLFEKHHSLGEDGTYMLGRQTK